jgi:putative SOS response-associated peptidase YedK
MCGRYVSPEQAAIERQWHIGRHNQPTLSGPFAARYNVAPQQGNPANYIQVVRQAEDGELELVRLQWWLLPFWSKEPRIKYSTFNARVETVAEAASFRDPLKRRRCIIPALGWYEWVRHEVACVIVRRAPPDRTCRPIGSSLRGIAIR